MTLEQLAKAGLVPNTVTIRGVAIEVLPITARQAATLLAINPAPPRGTTSIEDEARNVTLWHFSVAAHEVAVGIGLTIDGETFPWNGEAQTQRRWLEKARKEVGDAFTADELRTLQDASNGVGLKVDARKN